MKKQKDKAIINHKIVVSAFSKSTIEIRQYDAMGIFACKDILGRSWRCNSSFAPGAYNPHYAAAQKPEINNMHQNFMYEVQDEVSEVITTIFNPFYGGSQNNSGSGSQSQTADSKITWESPSLCPIYYFLFPIIYRRSQDMPG